VIPAPRVPINMGAIFVKTTVEIPDALFRKAKAAAAERGIPFGELVSEAIAEKLNVRAGSDKPWMRQFGKLRGLHKETERINRIIAEQFGHVRPEGSQLGARGKAVELVELWTLTLNSTAAR
jgi:hypothetical protein